MRHPCLCQERLDGRRYHPGEISCLISLNNKKIDFLFIRGTLVQSAPSAVMTPSGLGEVVQPEKEGAGYDAIADE